jgi:hypothetical protein
MNAGLVFEADYFPSPEALFFVALPEPPLALALELPVALVLLFEALVPLDEALSELEGALEVPLPLPLSFAAEALLSEPLNLAESDCSEEEELEKFLLP